MVWLHLTGRKVGAQKQIGSKYVMPKALRAMPKATCPWSMHGLHVRKAMGAKPKALGAKNGSYPGGMPKAMGAKIGAFKATHMEKMLW